MTPVANDLCVFAVKRGEMSERFDVYYWQYEFKVLEEKLDNCTFDVVPLEQLIAEKQGVKDGPGGWLINKSEYVDDGIPMLRGVNVLDGRIDLSNTVYITEEKHRQLAASEALPGDILITMRGTFGRAAILPNSIPKANMNAALCRIRLKDAALSEYLMWYLNSDIAYKQFKRHGTKAVQDDLNLGYIKAVRVIVPDLQTQQRSVADLKYKLEAANDKLNKAEMLFSDMSKYTHSVLKLAEVSSHKPVVFAVKGNMTKGARIDPEYHNPYYTHRVEEIEKINYDTLGNIIEFSTEVWDQKTIFNDVFPYIEISGVRVRENSYKAAAVPVSEAPSRAKMIVRNGDIIVSATRPHRGATATISCGESELQIASSGFCVLRELKRKDVLKEYLQWILTDDYVLLQMLQRSSGGNYPAITSGELKKIVIPIPDVSIQQQICAEATRRKKEAYTLRTVAEQEWQEAKEQFEKELLGE